MWEALPPMPECENRRRFNTTVATSFGSFLLVLNSCSSIVDNSPGGVLFDLTKGIWIVLPVASSGLHDRLQAISFAEHLYVFGSASEDVGEDTVTNDAVGDWNTEGVGEDHLVCHRLKTPFEWEPSASVVLPPMPSTLAGCTTVCLAVAAS